MSDELPAPKDVRDLLADLLGRDVTVQPDNPPSGEVPPTAVFVRDDLSLAGVIGFQLPLAANVAAAVGLIPPGGAEACVEDGELSPLFGENLAEVCNVLTTLFNRKDGPHVKFHALHRLGSEVPNDVVSHLQSLGNRLDLSVEVAGYGKGTFSLVVPL
ncbi:hypothetical protein [Actinophytocola xanthii]|uniref:Uncharacterized protein n=1 Tax=Actinophytocola xanthii TaxID=1912961 RepID=A0A1Q8BXU5_9PSEU|nr:hypothetical protein [Actinophytocola xanthii]OLF06912.1 hypothetical protein BU204_36050 [Actinophytocola xanthii]